MSLFNLNKKIYGHWGEERVDLYLGQWHWQILHKNLYFRGGEIDRVYLWQGGKVRKYCVAEVKVVSVKNQEDFCQLFSEVGIKKILRRHQLRNLFYFCEKFSALQGKNCEIYLRLFIVAVCKHGMREIDRENLVFSGIKLCAVEGGYFIFSLQPEFSPQRYQKSLVTTGIG